MKTKTTLLFLLFACFVKTALFASVSLQENDCELPLNIQVTEVNHNSVQFSWEHNPANESTAFLMYQFVISTENNPSAGPTTTDTEGTSIGYITLIPETTYFIYVRSFCTGEWSEWAEPVTFTTTACGTAQVPYLLDFESENGLNFPECTSVETFSGNAWQPFFDEESDIESGVITHTSHEDDPADAWFFTQGVQYNSDVKYKLSFQYWGDETGTASLGVRLSSIAGVVESENNITNLTVESTEIQTYTAGPISMTSDGVYFIGLHSNSTDGQGTIYVDNLLFEEWVCGEPTAIEIEDITSQDALLSWEPSGDNVTHYYQYIVSSEEIEPTDDHENIMTTGSPQNNLLEGLSASSTYYVYLKSSCSGVWSNWSSVTSFTTACDAEELLLPIGEEIHPFSEGETVADLEVTLVNGDSIVWYAQAEGGEPLNTETPLVADTTYYAASATEDGCESTTRFAVLVEETMSIDKWKSNSLLVYPNPSENDLVIESDLEINQIEIRNIMGQTVLKQSFNGTYKQTLSVETLPSGPYLMTVYAGSNFKNVKLVRK